jgi:hypothetical protein
MARKLRFVHIEGHMARSYQATNLGDVCPELTGTIFPTTPQADGTDKRDPRPTSVHLFYMDSSTVGSGSWGWSAYIADEDGNQITETVHGCWKAEVLKAITWQVRTAHLLRDIGPMIYSVTMDSADYPIEQEEIAANRALRA